MSADPRRLIEAAIEQAKPRAKSLIVTVYGDALLPRGGEVWLGALARLVEPFGLGERAVRTAVFRLVQDGILMVTKQGRRSYYALTETGRRHFDAAQRRIYATAEPDWDGGWTVALAAGALEAGERAAMRRELGWQGFAEAAPGVFLHPGDPGDQPTRTLAALGLCDRVVVFSARARDAPAGALGRLADRSWDLGGIDAAYRAFLDAFRPIAAALEGARVADPETAFLIRTLLIHEYRRTLLKDPSLPRALLPANWSGRRAGELARAIYRAVAWPAAGHVETVSRAAQTPLPPPEAAFERRFGGLARA